MASRLKLVLALATALTVVACKAPWSTSSTPTTVAVGTHIATTVATSVGAVETTTPTSQSAPPTIRTPTVTPTPTPPTTPPPSPSPTPTPSVSPSVVAQCCGVFDWLDTDRLLVFDTPSGAQQGSYLVNVRDGSRTLVGPVFGTLSSSGLIAFPNSQTGATEVRRSDSSLAATLQNGGSAAWIAPNGQRVAWLVDQGIANTSSLVKRIVKLVTANIDGSGQKSILEFEDSSLQWTSDNVHVVTIARAQDGTHPGIWSINTNDGTNSVVVQGTYLQALRVSPDGKKMAYLVTFSADASQDGVWVSDVDGSHSVHLSESGGFRWSNDSSSLWFLHLAPTTGGNDQLDEVDVASDSTVKSASLNGRVLGGEWEISPGADVVAFWNESDKTVHVQALTP